MRRLLNTLYILSEDTYLSLKDQNVVIHPSDGQERMIPLLSLEAIYSFSYKGPSPSLLAECSRNNIGYVCLSPQGFFQAQAAGRSNGNVLLRREQYRIADDPQKSSAIIRPMIIAKIYNCKWQIERTIRDHSLRIDAEKLKNVSISLDDIINQIRKEENPDVLRGLEGIAANKYFGVFDDLIVNQKIDFMFKGRNKRPPLDRVNAMLSFGYTLLAADCSSALESAGLDSYVGFLHRDRPGRASLSLDIMEEMRCIAVDRFVLKLINLNRIKANDFDVLENGSVYLNDRGKRIFITDWQKRKLDKMTHPFLKEEMPWGLIPFVQAQFLARYIRGDIDGYPPLMWK